MKKKLDYAGIPDDVLKMVIGESYGLGDYTVKDELDKYGEDLIFSQHNVRNGQVEWLRAWSKLKVFILINDLFGDKIILGIERNPPLDLVVDKLKKDKEEYERKENKRNKRRTKRNTRRK